MKKSHLLGAVFSFIIIYSNAAMAVSFMHLGDPAGGDFSSDAYGVSADGSVVVGDLSHSIVHGEAFRWTSEGGMVGLGYLLPDDYSGEVFSAARAVSADGSVVVGRGTSASGTEAFLWTSEGGMVGLGDLAGGSFYSDAYGVSADGSVVVGRGTSASGTEAFLWTSEGGMVGLGDLAGGSFYSDAYGVSADGSVVVGRGTSASGTEAFLWTSEGGMVGLGDLAGGSFYSDAYGVSADGSVVVGRGTSASGTEAFLWTSEGGMVGLGDPAGGSFYSVARGVSADGSVVVGRGTSASGTEAFLWTSEGSMQSVASILTTAGVDLTEWTLDRANGVSADGYTIAGGGINPDGFSEAWIADLSDDPIPPPIKDEVDDNLVYVAVEPCRLADTRPSQGGTGNLAENEDRNFEVYGAVASQGGDTGGCPHPRAGTGVEPLAASVYLVAIPTGASSGGWLTAFPSDQTTPTSSSVATVNFAAGQVIGNTTNVTLCPGGCPAGGPLGLVAYSSEIDVVIDVQGYFYPAAGSCSADMVAVGSLCVDKYEASVWTAATGGTQYNPTGDPGTSIPCDTGGADCSDGAATPIYARSVAGVIPALNVTWYQAAIACANVDKRLPTTAEWQMAASGTPSGLASGCNFSGAATATGTNAGCESTVGAFDMIGNVWEWVADLNIGSSITTTNDGMVSAIGDGYDNQGDASTRALWNISPQSSDARIGIRCVR